MKIIRIIINWPIAFLVLIFGLPVLFILCILEDILEGIKRNDRLIGNIWFWEKQKYGTARHKESYFK